MNCSIPPRETAHDSVRLPLLLTGGILVGLLATGHGHSAATAASPCGPRAFEGSNYIICTFDLRAYSLRLFWKDENGKPYGGFEHLPRRINAAPIVFAMNAGMYKADPSPVGLYIESGKTLKPANTAKGPGNFHIKPNGIFYINGHEAGVLTTERFLSQRPRAEFGTQSGPMLVIDGHIHPRILPASTSRKIRSATPTRWCSRSLKPRSPLGVRAPFPGRT